MREKIIIIIIVFFIFTFLSGMKCDPDEESFVEVWRTDIGNFENCKIYKGVKVIIALVDEEKLISLDHTTGEILWETGLEHSVYNSIALYNRMLFVGDEAGYLTTLNPGNGEELWSLEIDEPFQKEFSFHNDILYCGAGKSIYAIDVDNQNIRWTKTLKNEEGMGVWSAPTVIDDRILTQVGTHIYCLSNKSGDVVWSYKTCDDAGGKYNNPVVVGDGRVFTGTPTEHFIGLDVKSGELLWQYNACEGIYNDKLDVRPYYYKGEIIFGFDATITSIESSDGPGSESVGRIVCLDGKDGEEKWVQDFPTSGDIACYENFIYLIADDTLHRKNIKNLKTKSFPLPGKYSSGFVVHDRKVYMVIDGNYLMRAKILLGSVEILNRKF